MAQRGFDPEVVETARRFLNGEIKPGEMLPSLMRLSKAYDPYIRLWQIPIAALGARPRA